MSRPLAFAAGGVLLAAVVVVAWLVVARPASSGTTLTGVTVECGGIANEGACVAWGIAVLDAGPPVRVWEIEDVVRIRLALPWPVLGGGCRAEYYLGRYPDEVAASAEVPCPDE